MGGGPLPYARRRAAYSCTRYVRAFLSHRLRRQGGYLCRNLHARDPLGQCGSALCIRRTQEVISSRCVGIAFSCDASLLACLGSASTLSVLPLRSFASSTMLRSGRALLAWK